MHLRNGRSFVEREHRLIILVLCEGTQKVNLERLARKGILGEKGCIFHPLGHKLSFQATLTWRDFMLWPIKEIVATKDRGDNLSGGVNSAFAI